MLKIRRHQCIHYHHCKCKQTAASSPRSFSDLCFIGSASFSLVPLDFSFTHSSLPGWSHHNQQCWHQKCSVDPVSASKWGLERPLHLISKWCLTHTLQRWPLLAFLFDTVVGIAPWKTACMKSHNRNKMEIALLPYRPKFYLSPWKGWQAKTAWLGPIELKVFLKTLFILFSLKGNLQRKK